MKKRIWSILLVLCIVAVSVPTTVFAGREDAPVWDPNWIADENNGFQYACYVDGVKEEFGKINLNSLQTGQYTVSEPEKRSYL